MTRDFACALLVATIFGSLVHQSVLAETTSVLAMVQQAKSHARQGDHAMAAQILDQARMMAPNSEDVLSDFAKNSLAAGDPVGAINTLEPLMRIHPKVAEYPYLLGVALLQVKEYQPSANALRRSLEIEPQRSLTLLALGITLLSQKQFGEAREFAARSLEIEPAEAEALAVLSEAEAGLGDLEKAEFHADRALSLAPTHAGANFVLGRVRMSQGRFEEAKEYFLKAIQITPNSSRIHYQLSLAYARLNDPENSKKYRELHQQTRKENTARVESMRKRAGLKESGMRPD